MSSRESSSLGEVLGDDGIRFSTDVSFPTSLEDSNLDDDYRKALAEFEGMNDDEEEELLIDLSDDDDDDLDDVELDEEQVRVIREKDEKIKEFEKVMNDLKIQMAKVEFTDPKELENVPTIEEIRNDYLQNIKSKKDGDVEEEEDNFLSKLETVKKEFEVSEKEDFSVISETLKLVQSRIEESTADFPEEDQDVLVLEREGKEAENTSNEDKKPVQGEKKDKEKKKKKKKTIFIFETKEERELVEQLKRQKEERRKELKELRQKHLEKQAEIKVKHKERMRILKENENRIREDEKRKEEYWKINEQRIDLEDYISKKLKFDLLKVKFVLRKMKKESEERNMAMEKIIKAKRKKVERERKKREDEERKRREQERRERKKREDEERKRREQERRERLVNEEMKRQERIRLERLEKLRLKRLEEEKKKRKELQRKMKEKERKQRRVDVQKKRNRRNMKLQIQVKNFLSLVKSQISHVESYETVILKWIKGERTRRSQYQESKDVAKSPNRKSVRNSFVDLSEKGVISFEELVGHFQNIFDVESLIVDKNEIRSLNVGKYKNLRVLAARFNRIKSLTDINNGLLELNLRANELSALENFRNPKSLDKLIVAKNKISFVAQLHSLLLLRELNISENKITEFDKQLEFCRMIEILTAYENQFERFPNLHHIFVRKVFLQRNFIKSDFPIFTPCLTTLALAGNKISSLRFLENQKLLKAVDLRNNVISKAKELRYFRNCPRIELLKILGNPISVEKNEQSGIPNYRKILIVYLKSLKDIDGFVVNSGVRDSCQALFMSCSTRESHEKRKNVLRFLKTRNELEEYKKIQGNNITYQWDKICNAVSVKRRTVNDESYEACCLSQNKQNVVIDNYFNDKMRNENNGLHLVFLKRKYVEEKRKLFKKQYFKHLDFENSFRELNRKLFAEVVLCHETIFREKESSALLLQRFLSNKLLGKMRKDQEEAAILVQKVWRGYKISSRVLFRIRKRVELKKRAATKIQKIWRGYYVRKTLKNAANMDDFLNFNLEKVDEDFEIEKDLFDDVALHFDTKTHVLPYKSKIMKKRYLAKVAEEKSKKGKVEHGVLFPKKRVNNFFSDVLSKTDRKIDSLHNIFRKSNVNKPRRNEREQESLKSSFEKHDETKRILTKKEFVEQFVEKNGDDSRKTAEMYWKRQKRARRKSRNKAVAQQMSDPKFRLQQFQKKTNPFKTTPLKKRKTFSRSGKKRDYIPSGRLGIKPVSRNGRKSKKKVRLSKMISGLESVPYVIQGNQKKRK